MPKNETPEEQKQLLFVEGGGAQTRIVSTVREVKTYPLNENELHSITWFNTLTSIFGSVDPTPINQASCS